MKLKKEYVAPNLTVVSFKVERGYATSPGSIIEDQVELLGNMEIFQQSGSEMLMGDAMTDMTDYFGYGSGGTTAGTNDGYSWF